MSLNDCINMVESIYNKYSDNDHIKSKIYEYINKELPERIQNYKEHYEKKGELEQDAEAYINEFLINSNEKYLYISKSNMYVKYDGKNFEIENESNLIHYILTDLNKQKHLLQWKHKIKNIILKRIKDTCLFNIIPESNTIQRVLKFFSQTIFNKKETSKYFLTIMGDNILKKQSELVHLVDIKSKTFITSIEDHISQYFKSQYHINTTFKYAWHDHPYKNCRVINFSYLIDKIDIWSAFIRNNILNIISVAVYYSKRYGSSENFITITPKNPATKNILYLKDKTGGEIVKQFISTSLYPKETSTGITVKEMEYIWKIYLGQQSLPYIMFYNTFHSLLKDEIKFDTNNCKYCNIDSKYLDNSKKLDDFWREYIIEETGDELELSEICDLYNGTIGTSDDTEFLDEEFLAMFLMHFYDIKINDKYIRNKKCILWNRGEETDIVFKELRTIYKFSPDSFEKGVDYAYLDYSKLCDDKYKFRVVSKRWFEKYINRIIPEKYIIKKRILNTFWNS